jgi:DNA-binding Lrp family transcriptional regulator
MGMDLDKFDRRILFELEKDSSISLSKLSRIISRTKQFVLFRIKRLEKEGIIEGYQAIVDMSKLGYMTYRVYFDMQNTTLIDEEKFVEFIKEEIPQVWTITRMHGKWDYALFIGVRSIPQFHEVWDKIMFSYKNNIKKYNIAIYAPIFNFNRRFFVNEGRVIERIYGEGKQEESDDFDIKLIHAYATDVRQSYLELGRKIKTSHDRIRERIRRLENKKIIVGYKIGLNLEKLGFQGYRVDIELNSTKHNKGLFEFCKNNKFIYQVNKSIGGADFEIEVVVKDLVHLNKLIEEIKENFKEDIKDIEYFGFSKFYLLKFIPD